jgi:ClpP class serine protease
MAKSEIIRLDPKAKGMRADLVGEVLNTPLLVTYDYAVTVSNVVLDRISSGRDIAIVNREVDLAHQMIEEQAMGDTIERTPLERAMDRQPDIGYRDWYVRPEYPNIGVIPMSGSVSHISGPFASFGGTYASIRRDMMEAAQEPGIEGLILMMNGPGGTLPGVTATAELIRDIAQTMPVWAMVNEMMCSAHQWMGIAANRTYLTNVGCQGSIGAYIVRMDLSAALEDRGIKPYIFTTGDLKAVGMREKAMSPEEEQYFTERMDKVGDQFFSWVSENSDLSVEDVRALRGAPVQGEDAVTNGLANDTVQSDEHFFQLFSDHLNSSGESTVDKRFTQSQVDDKVSTAVEQAKGELKTEHATALSGVQEKLDAANTEIENLKAETPDTDKIAADAAANERDRIFTVLSSPVVRGREKTAVAWFKMPQFVSTSAEDFLTALESVERAEIPEGKDEDGASMASLVRSAEKAENAGTGGSAENRGSGTGSEDDGTGDRKVEPSGKGADTGLPANVRAFADSAASDAKKMADRNRAQRRA